jgi:hypothetical protein
MKIVVLSQDGIPIYSAAVPTSLFKEYEHRDFAKKLEDQRRKELVSAFVTLHPPTKIKEVCINDIPTLTTYILDLDNCNIIDEKVAEVGPCPIGKTGV